MIYHHPYRPPVKINEDKVILTDRTHHSIPASEIRDFIFGQVERLTRVYGIMSNKSDKLDTKKYSPFHGE